MKCCISTYSFGDYVRRADFGIEAAIDWAAKQGAEGLEIVTGTFEGSDTVETAEKIKEKLARVGMVAASVCTGADFLNGSNGDLDAEVERLCRMVDVAAAYGVSVMRHDATRGFVGKKHSIGYDNALPRLAEGCRLVSEYAATKGIVTCTENHGFYSQDAARVEKLVNTVACDNFGALVDIGNFMCADEDPVKSVGLMAPYAVHVHAKDFFCKSGLEVDPGCGWFRTRAGNYLRGTIIGHGDAKARQSLGILKHSGYDGWISIEFEGIEDKLLGISEGLKNVRRFWEMG